MYSCKLFVFKEVLPFENTCEWDSRCFFLKLFSLEFSSSSRSLFSLYNCHSHSLSLGFFKTLGGFLKDLRPWKNHRYLVTLAPTPLKMQLDSPGNTKHFTSILVNCIEYFSWNSGTHDYFNPG